LRWFTKILIGLVILFILSGIGLMIYAINARMQGTEYQFQVEAVLSAAAMANADEVHMTGSRTVIAEYQGERVLINPANYKALSSYLRKDAAMPLFSRVDKSKALHLTILDIAEAYVMPQDEQGDRICISFTSSGRSFTMSARGGNLWSSLLSCSMKGTWAGDNYPLDN